MKESGKEGGKKGSSDPSSRASRTQELKRAREDVKRGREAREAARAGRERMVVQREALAAANARGIRSHSTSSVRQMMGETGKAGKGGGGTVREPAKKTVQIQSEGQRRRGKRR